MTPLTSSLAVTHCGSWLSSSSSPLKLAQLKVRLGELPLHDILGFGGVDSPQAGAINPSPTFSKNLESKAASLLPFPKKEKTAKDINIPPKSIPDDSLIFPLILNPRIQLRVF